MPGKKTVEDPGLKMMLEREKERGRPTVVFKDREGNVDRDATIRNLGRNDAEDFLEKIDEDFPENRPLSFKNKLKRGMVEGYAEGGMVKKSNSTMVMPRGYRTSRSKKPCKIC